MINIKSYQFIIKIYKNATMFLKMSIASLIVNITSHRQRPLDSRLQKGLKWAWTETYRHSVLPILTIVLILPLALP
jgi:hypothetical protein